MSAAKGCSELYPFDKAMAFGLGVLRLDPTKFWAMTPVELAFLSGAASVAGNRMVRDELEGLIKLYPDEI